MTQLSITAEELLACFHLHPDQLAADPDNEGWSFLSNQYAGSSKHRFTWRLYQGDDVLSLVLDPDSHGSITFTVEPERFSFDMDIPTKPRESHKEQVWSSNLLDVLEQVGDIMSRLRGKSVKGERMTVVRDDMSYFIRQLDHLITMDDYPEDADDAPNQGIDPMEFIDANH